ncbi:hypothetical protein BCV69DRAFT_283668 [Microstroma glucosiphilum]|uniref:Secreted protein n=1 Tax=Pseudomicrostroma glucosiphilum TaxID=1684307 RepID=A0A316U6P1_9BASI|nr:hypothetical protein BCV69DRAFT_283668 [Pseudomicrostroma glucosiphilum]PWN20131.1 hypothetical protein BCV69DRAFT_283668 [Pseudomicrostroma glucosiphilum]
MMQEAAWSVHVMLGTLALFISFCPRCSSDFQGRSANPHRTRQAAISADANDQDERHWTTGTPG